MPSPPLLLMDDRNGVCDPAAAACGGGAEERAAAAAAEAGGGYEFGLEQVAAYLTACCLLWVAVIVLLRVVVFRKSARIPVFRITPDRRDVIEDMESTEWMQAVVNKAFHALKADADPDELMQAITHAVNKVLHLSGGKFELHSLDIGDAPPQLCGVEARRAGGGDHRHEYLLDLFYQGGLSACFGVEHPVDLPLLGTSMFPVKVFIQSLELQLRLKVIWDAAAHHAPPPPPGEQAKPAAKPSQLHPDPARKSTLEISLANIPDISMRMSTELGARHVIADSQFLTSLLAVLTHRWLQRKLLWPNKVKYTFKLPAFAVPASDAAREDPARRGAADADGGSAADGMAGRALSQDSTWLDPLRALGTPPEQDAAPGSGYYSLRDLCASGAHPSSIDTIPTTPPRMG